MQEVGFKTMDVAAAGGLVTNASGDVLMILRDGVWDLPKGHREEGEDMEVTARREVEEETGVSGLEVGGLICVTSHWYFRNGIWCHKHTWWYSMTSESISSPVPQQEEGISEAAWVPRRLLHRCLEGTYPSIREVFLRGGISF